MDRVKPEGTPRTELSRSRRHSSSTLRDHAEPYRWQELSLKDGYGFSILLSGVWRQYDPKRFVAAIAGHRLRCRRIDRGDG